MSQHHKPMHVVAKVHSAASGVLPEDEIRSRAFELYEQRGRQEGHDIEDWLRAEEEISKVRGNRKAA